MGSSFSSYGSASCSGCEAYRPVPQRSGNLQVDPEIHLPSPGMDVDIAYYYNAAATNNGPFGYGRQLSTNLTAQASGSPAIVTLTRANGALVSFQDDGMGTFVAKTPGVLNTLTKDVPNSLWKETTPDGFTFAYPLDTTGQISSITYREDAPGNRHTFSYAAGLLSSIQETAGRRVTFTNSGGLVVGIQDWADRRTTFQYDTVTASPKNLLTTVIGPSGCNTVFGHSTFALYKDTSDWFLSKITDPNGFATDYTFDQQRRAVSRSVSGVGRTTFLYNPGFMVTMDALNNISTQALGDSYSLSAVQAPTGGTVSFTRNANLQETSRQDPTGAVWSTSHDAAGMVTKQQDPAGSVTSFTRDAFNNLTSQQTMDGAFVTFIWGYGGSPFDTTGAKRRMQAVVDQLGNRTSFGFNARGQIVTEQNALGAVTTHGYDAFGNRISTQNSLGAIWTNSYDLAGNLIASMTPIGTVWSSVFDSQNRKIASINPLGAIVTAGFDSGGNRVVEINELGFRTSWTYNAFDKPVSRQDSLGAFWTTVYDSLGQL